MARVRRRSTTRNRSSFTLLLVLAGLLVVLILLHVTGPLKPVEGVVLRLLRPGMSATQTVGSETGGLFSTLSGIGSLPKENAVLREEVDRLLVEAARVEELERENALLREQLGFVEEAQAETVPALVIGQPPFAEFQLIVLDKGERDGVHEGDTVVLSNGLLVGRVLSVSTATSEVLLLTDSHSSVHTVVQGSRANGIVEGDRGLGLLLTSVPHESELKVGDRVVTTGLAGQFPKGLLVGTIEDAPDPGNDLFREARVKPVVDFDQLEFVFVITAS